MKQINFEVCPFRLNIFPAGHILFSPFLSYSAELSACWQQRVMNTKSKNGKKAKKT
jgi:hypothetical protein